MGGVRPASSRAIGLSLELGPGTSVARGWADPGLQKGRSRPENLGLEPGVG